MLLYGEDTIYNSGQSCSSEPFLTMIGRQSALTNCQAISRNRHENTVVGHKYNPRMKAYTEVDIEEEPYGT